MKNLTTKAIASKLLLISIGLLIVSLMPAQNTRLPFQSGEQLNYNVHYKYGFVMAKAGTARYEVKDSSFKGNPCFRSSLTFKTTSFFDNIYKIRDTLISYSNTDLEPIFHRKHLHEGKTYYKEDIRFIKFSESHTSAKSKRYTEESVRFDTLLHSSSSGFDMVSIFMFVRTIDYSTLKKGDCFNLTSFVGRDAIPMVLRYMEPKAIEIDSKKYKTLRFELDLTDDAFSANKKAMEIWISEEPSRIPVKLRAKLKIGAAEAELSSAKNIKSASDSKAP